MSEIFPETPATAGTVTGTPGQALTRWRGTEVREVDAAQLTPDNLDELWQSFESKPHYDAGRNVDGLAVYADHGREVALFGDWIVRNADNGLPWTTSDADFRARFTPAAVAAAPQPDRAHRIAAALYALADELDPDEDTPAPSIGPRRIAMRIRAAVREAMTIRQEDT